jgi:hypothetical protein
MEGSVRVFVLVKVNVGVGGEIVGGMIVCVKEGVWGFIEVRVKDDVKVADGASGVTVSAVVIDEVGESVLSKVNVGVRVKVTVRTGVWGKVGETVEVGEATSVSEGIDETVLVNVGI